MKFAKKWEKNGEKGGKTLVGGFATVPPSVELTCAAVHERQRLQASPERATQAGIHDPATSLAVPASVRQQLP
eukprot:2801648-Amphidinium_carterae.1